LEERWALVGREKSELGLERFYWFKRVSDRGDQVFILFSKFRGGLSHRERVRPVENQRSESVIAQRGGLDRSSRAKLEVTKCTINYTMVFP
jgi:hypothetical protein